MKYRSYQKEKFRVWRNHVKGRLPTLVALFYCFPNTDYRDHVQIGKLITFINDPFYSLVDDDYKPKDELCEMAAQIALRLLTKDVFRKVYSKTKLQTA